MLPMGQTNDREFLTLLAMLAGIATIHVGCVPLVDDEHELIDAAITDLGPPIPPIECTEVQVSGAMQQKLNIVFVPSHHYGSRVDDFLSDAVTFKNSFLHFPFYAFYERRINFFAARSVDEADVCVVDGITPHCDADRIWRRVRSCGFSEAHGDQVVVLFDDSQIMPRDARGKYSQNIVYVSSGWESVFVHEFSHSFGDLADAYDQPFANTVPPSSPNCASDDPGFTCQDKWGDLIGLDFGDGPIGCYQNCGASNWYRPTLDGDVMRNSTRTHYDAVSLRWMHSLMSRYSDS